MTAPARLSRRDHLRLLPRRAAGDLVGVLTELFRRHGRVVDFGYGSGRMVLVFGAEANEHVLSMAAHTFERGGAMQALVAVDGPTALVVSDGVAVDDHEGASHRHRDPDPQGRRADRDHRPAMSEAAR